MTSPSRRTCSFDPYSTTSGVLQAVISGALTLVNPADFKPSTRRAARLALSAGTGAFTTIVMHRAMKRGFAEATPGGETAPDGETAPGDETAPADGAQQNRVALKMGLTIGGVLTVLSYGGLVAGEWVDARIHHALVRRGVARPRVAMAIGTAAASYGLFELDRRTRKADEAEAAPGIPSA